MARSRVGSEKAQQTLELPSELGRRPRGYVDKATECVNMEPKATRKGRNGEPQS